MDTRRDFLKKAALLAAGGSAAGVLPASIRRALAIDPLPGTTYLDAEHVVILMQENRSFDHCFGALRGVRGFDDPRAVTLPNGNLVWLQTNRDGETYAPFRLNIKDTKATWMSYLPHNWTDQSDARNHGRHDRWLEVKTSGRKDYAHLPLTLGYYNREDLPFYYAFADAFTVCDQNFCSSLTGTTPNRLHLWSGTIRANPSIDAHACVRNEEADHHTEVGWKTFPERLEEAGVSWRIYQNEITIESGLTSEEDRWLSNYGDNPIEYFTQYGVRFSPQHRAHMAGLVKTLPEEIATLEATAKPWPDELEKKLAKLKKRLKDAKADLEKWSEENFQKLTPHERNLHTKAFTTNTGDPDHRSLTTLTYKDGDVEREMRVPKGDVHHQFREDVKSGKLPTVSWIVAPENFSDHPSAPWYGAWYISEALDILTQNPEVWRKTIFILCYDENDGYFDHIPPFVPPYPDQPQTGKVSAGIDVSVEHVSPEQEKARRGAGRFGPIGLGYRVPLVIASPWSRGGYVCSQVFDHTSILRLLEDVVSRRSGKGIRETNISAWRRTVCGDLSSVFRPYQGEKIALPQPVEREAFLGKIHQAQFKSLPTGFKKLEADDIRLAKEAPHQAPWLPRQEKGTRPSCALPYELGADGALSADRSALVIQLRAGNSRFGKRAAGAPFNVYAPGKMRAAGGDKLEAGRVRAYAVSAGDQLQDAWTLAEFENGYDLHVHGPNGFYREFRGTAEDPALDVTFVETPEGDATLRLTNRNAQRPLTVVITDAAYGAPERKITLTGKTEVAIALASTQGWHDLRISVVEAPQFHRRYAGRVETGRESISDPLLGHG